MKKNVHCPANQIIFHCIACSQEFQSFSVSSENVRIGHCSNCSSFYTGAAASEVKVGEVEKFRQRAQKVKEKNNER